MKTLVLFALQVYTCLTESYQEPSKAFPALSEQWSGQEEIDTLGDLTVFRLIIGFPMYLMSCFVIQRYGPGLNDNWILWAHDIYGVDSGRTKELCAKMNTELGVTCILPDFFRGQEWPDPVPVWETGLREDWEFKINPYLIERGARRVGQ